MKKTQRLNLVEISACGYKNANKKLNFTGGDRNARIQLLIQELLRKDKWDLISVRNFPYNALLKIQEDMENRGFKLYIHEKFHNEPGKWRYSCLQVLFVREGLEFKQEYRIDKGEVEEFETIYRYICGVIKFAGNDIHFKTSHFPCASSWSATQVKRKIDMLEDEIRYQQLRMNELAISAGNYNTDLDGDFVGKDQFAKLKWLDIVSQPTYTDEKNKEMKKLDHCFISKPLQDSGAIQVTIEVLDHHYSVLTDHKIISIKLQKY